MLSKCKSKKTLGCWPRLKIDGLEKKKRKRELGALLHLPPLPLSKLLRISKPLAPITPLVPRGGGMGGAGRGSGGAGVQQGAVSGVERGQHELELKLAALAPGAWRRRLRRT